jgi:hypothetical protein
LRGEDRCFGLQDDRIPGLFDMEVDLDPHRDLEDIRRVHQHSPEEVEV